MMCLPGLAQDRNPAYPPKQRQSCPKQTIKAYVVAIDRALAYNRFGAEQPGGMIFALARDVYPQGNADQNCRDNPELCKPGQVKLRASKRPRPLVLRVDQGDDLEIHFTNLLNPAPETESAPNPTQCQTPGTTGGTLCGAQTETRRAGVNVNGLELVSSIKDDGSFVGRNDSSLVPPGDGITYKLHAVADGAYFLSSSAGNLGGTGMGQISAGMFGAVNVEPGCGHFYRSQVTREDLQLASGGKTTSSGQPELNLAAYNSTYPAGARYPDGKLIPKNTPILAIVNSDNEIAHNDLTAIIAGPRTDPNHQGWWPDDPANPLFRPNPAEPERNQPFREFTIIYHDDFEATQAFPTLYNPQSGDPTNLAAALSTVQDAFGINYGFGGIGSEILANRFQVGPSTNCPECRYEEFFLSSWATGDPAMVVNVNATDSLASGCPSGSGCKKATVAFYPDDPSNVYHSYLNDHLQFRILSADSALHHVHHQHAHQWLHTPNSDQSAYLDSQLIGPGSTFTLEIAYGGSGNRNKTPGDSIFHCHFYPHFAEGMWALWRVHDVFEEGTRLLTGNDWPQVAPGARALPDGEIGTGTPIPALVPIPSLPMAPMPSSVFIQNGQVVYGTPASPDPTGKNVKTNPGYPFFVPGLASHRAPQPPLDFALDPATHQPLDGGLPRNVITSGTIAEEEHTQYNFTKTLGTLKAQALDEQGTNVEKVAMAFNAHSPIATSRPDGQPGNFTVNGQGPQQGAPYADPCPLHPVMRQYKAADIQLDVILNKKGWHNPQQRMLALWGDVIATKFGDKVTGSNQKAPEPLFFRAKSTDCIEYWQTNLVPSYYELDNFQVRTPTDVIGQHIHLVKFDVTASDGAANGFNYEDGSLSPDEVQERIEALNKDNGFIGLNGNPQTLNVALPPFFCEKSTSFWYKEYCSGTTGSNGHWAGAQTTIQRWWADPLLDNSTPQQKSFDRTLRTVFTHDHFGPSTHQQVGLYAGLVVEPEDSKWQMPDPNNPSHEIDMGTRFDGGPTSWQADIITGSGGSNSYREFLLEFEDLQLAFLPKSKQTMGTQQPSPPDYTGTDMNVLTKVGWFDAVDQTVNPPQFGNAPGCNGSTANPALGCTTPDAVSGAFTEGTYSLNYRNEPFPFRVWEPVQSPPPGFQPGDKSGDLAKVMLSIKRADSDLNTQPVYPTTLASIKNNPPNQQGGANNQTPYPQALQPTGADGVDAVDPFTPLLRGYQGDRVQVRLLTGSHLAPHDFGIPGLNWLFEPSYPNSGYRNTQAMGISEHFEMLFTLPPTAGDADYAYIADNSTNGTQNGIWGLIRAYDGKKGQKPALPFLPNNPTGSAPAGQTNGCPANAPRHNFKVHAINTDANNQPLVLKLNKRLDVTSPGMIYVLDQDYAAVKSGQRPAEPLVLRANAGECVHVELINEFDVNSPYFTQLSVDQNEILGPFGGSPYGTTVPTANYGISLFTSQTAGLHPQLVAYDVTQNDGLNVGRNPVHTVPAQGCTGHCTGVYEWYAGALYDPTTGEGGASTAKYNPHPVEFGAANLLPADLMQQHQQGLYGGLIIEPAGSKVTLDQGSNISATVTPPNGKPFRDFVLIMNDDVINEAFASNLSAVTTSAANYGAEPFTSRFGFNIKKRAFNQYDLSCSVSDKFVLSSSSPQFSPQNAVGDFRTPTFAAGAGSPARFHVLNPGGVNDQIFEMHGHVWQEEPYQNNSSVIGNNPLSQWMGMRMGEGPTNHFDVVLPSAGGINQVQGDYLYRAHYDLGFQGGVLGAFRVGAPGKDVVTITANFQAPTLLLGYNTVNTSTGKYASQVSIFNGTPSGTGCSGTQVSGSPVTSIASGNGFWNISIPSGTTTLCAVSSEGGVAALDLKAHVPEGCAADNDQVQAAPASPALGNSKDQEMTRPTPPKAAPKK